MQVFVEHFAQIGDSRLTVGDLADRLPHKYTPLSRATRATKARSIFASGLQREALSRIASATRVDPTVRSRAQELLSTR